LERLLDSCVSFDVRDDWIDRQLKTARPNRLLSDPGCQWGRNPHGFNVTGLLSRWRQCKTSGCPRTALSWQDPTGAFPSVWVKEGTSQSAIDVVYAALRLRNVMTCAAGVVPPAALEAHAAGAGSFVFPASFSMLRGWGLAMLAACAMGLRADAHLAPASSCRCGGDVSPGACLQ
jgi:hypothetical protein